MPQVSVILAFHRITPFLEPAVRSILDQTLRDIELFLVDNGTGIAPEVLGEVGRDARVKWIRFPENRGIAAAHNAVVEQAAGEFIALMDYDDVALPRRFECQIAAFRADPRLMLLFTHADAIDADGRVIEPQFTLASERDLKVFSAFSMPATPPTLMARCEILRACPMRTEFRISPDYDLFSRLVESCPARALPEVLFHYRRHAEQTTQTAQAVQVQNACRIRLLTARRRSGRPETNGPLATEFGGWPDVPPPAAITYAEFAARALAEDFPLLAVYFVRKRLSVSRTVSAAMQSFVVLVKALGRAPRQAPALVRMFFTGPLRTFGLRPVGVDGRVTQDGDAVSTSRV